MSSAELKSLQVKLRETIKELAETELIIGAAKEKVSALKNQKNNLQVKIDNLTKIKDKIVVSEHAILRYIERQFGVKREDVAEQITKGYEDAIRKVQSGQINRADGVKLVIKDRVVITVKVASED